MTRSAKLSPPPPRRPSLRPSSSKMPESPVDEIEEVETSSVDAVLPFCSFQWRESKLEALLRWRREKMGAMWTYFLIGTNYFLVGLEKGVIVPSLWLFITEIFGVTSGNFYGVTVASYSVTSMTLSFVFGYFYEKMTNAKLILILGDVCAICGMFLYVVAAADWFILLSRLLTGVTWAVRPALLGDVSRATNIKDRTTVFSAVEVCEPLGFIVGPICLLFLSKSNFYITKYVHINQFTSSGLFMFILYSFHLLGTTLCYKDLKGVDEDDDDLELENENLVKRPVDAGDDSVAVTALSGYGTGPGSLKAEETEDETEDEEEEEKEMAGRCQVEDELVETYPGKHPEMETSFGPTPVTKKAKSEAPESSESSKASTPTMDDAVAARRRQRRLSSRSSKDGRTRCCGSLMKFLLNDHYLCLLFGDFVTWFGMMAILTISFPMGEMYFGWDLLKSGIVATILMLIVVVSYGLLNFLSRTIKDERRFLIIFQVLSFFSTIALMTCAANAVPGNMASERAILSATGVYALFTPLNSVLNASHLTKLVSTRKQGLALGLRGIFEGGASILAPIWAGAMLNISLFGLFGFNCLMILVTLGMVLGSWRRLKVT